jgi:hypothetical protein
VHASEIQRSEASAAVCENNSKYCDLVLQSGVHELQLAFLPDSLANGLCWPALIFRKTERGISGSHIFPLANHDNADAKERQHSMLHISRFWRSLYSTIKQVLVYIKTAKKLHRSKSKAPK